MHACLGPKQAAVIRLWPFQVGESSRNFLELGCHYLDGSFYHLQSIPGFFAGNTREYELLKGCYVWVDYTWSRPFCLCR